MRMSKPSAIIPDSPGKIRPAQIITTYGPGSIMQTEFDSVMIMGIDFWANKKNYIRKHHPYIQKITRCDHFKMPYAEEEQKRTISCTSYPRWGYCSICKWLQPHSGSPGSTNQFMCRKHTRTPLLPARIITVCKRGHVGEFPWVEWAHSDPKNPQDVCENPRLEWKRGMVSSSISHSKVICSCGASHRMLNSLGQDGITLYKDGKQYKYECAGESPWLDKQEDCKKIQNEDEKQESGSELPMGMLARSTSLYYAKAIRGIIIPQLAHPIVRFLQSEEYATWENMPVFKSWDPKTKAEQILGANKQKWEGREYTTSDIVKFMEEMANRESSSVETEDDLKQIEYEDLRVNESFDDEQDEKEISIKDVEIDQKNLEYFDVIRQMEILTAIEVLQYFTRLRPPGATSYDNNTICKIEVAGKTRSGRKYERNRWLPCVVKKGEGIFIIFNKKFVESCLKNDVIKTRLASMIKNREEWERNSNWPDSPNMNEQYIFLHSISHVLIKELVASSGYSEASISERIYSSGDMRGVLIYTTSAGEGSLGGLTRQASDIPDILKRSLEKLKSCSRDPICINEDPEAMRTNGIPLHLAQNGSACYGCLILPETSCENFNRMLDRKILVDDDYGVAGTVLDD